MATKESLAVAVEAMEMAAFPLGVPLEFLKNPNPREMAKWLNQEIKDRSDLLRAAIEKIKANGDYPQ